MRKYVGGRVLPPLGPTSKDIWVFLYEENWQLVLLDLDAECLTVSAFAVEVTQPADCCTRLRRSV